MSKDSGNTFQRFVEIVQALRTPVTGCPWDLEQTHDSIKKYLVEETYEVIEAIDSRDDTEFRAELGDLLLQVVLHSQIASDRAAFSIDDVVNGIIEKMIRRHPHVFGDSQVNGSNQVLQNWEKIKLEERKAKGDPSSMLAGVPKAMPALLRAQRIGEKASKVGFDWKEVTGVWEKLQEEMLELQTEYQSAERTPTPLPEPLRTRVESELGDLLFAAAQLGRWLGIDSEEALKGCCERFVSRFAEMERSSAKPLSEQSEGELDAAWEAAKKALESGSGTRS